MAQGHMDRLTSVDASFLTNESATSHMHVGAVLIFEGPPPNYPDFLEHVRGRLHLVPRFRQKLAFPPIETGRPFWVDDPNFNLAYHVRHSALPSPGSEEQLRNIAGRLFSQRLDRSKPLWEIWLVQGLERGRFALISKTHHSLVDGIAGVDIATVLFDLKPVPEQTEPDDAWVPSRRRPRPRWPRGASCELSEAPFKLTSRRSGRPATRKTTQRVAEARQALGEVAWNFTNPAPELPLNVEIGPHRRFAWSRASWRTTSGSRTRWAAPSTTSCSTVVSGALRRWLQGRGDQHRGPGAARAGAGLDSRRGRARADGQPDRRHARAAACLRRGPGQAARGRPRVDGRGEGVEAGPRRRGDLTPERLRARRRCWHRPPGSTSRPGCST